MTQERKDQLYDEMIAWICGRTPNDEELFQILHGQFSMTKEELHDHCIESLDSFFPADDARIRLERKVNANYAEYKKRWRQMTPTELINRCEELEAVTRMAQNLPSAVSDDNAEYLLRFKNPLEVASDAWISENGIDSLIIDEDMRHILWNLMDRGGAEEIYEMEPEIDESPEVPTMSM